MQLLQLILFCFASTAVSADSMSASSILDFINKQDSKFELGNSENVVLLIGDTGTGKSTVGLLLTGATLESVRNKDGFTIHDKNNTIGNVTADSKTDIPQLMLDQEFNVPYYDCPGFKDTRSPEYDISIAFLINKLLTRAKSFKIVLVVSHLSLQTGGTRPTFPNLLTVVVSLFKNIDMYKKGIGLISNRVPNQMIQVDDGFVPIPDARIVQSIAGYMKETRDSMTKLLSHEYFFRSKSTAYAEELKLLDVLMEKNNKTENVYDRIAILRSPSQAGLLDDMPEIQQEKRNMRKMIENNLQFVGQDKTFGFGLIISPDSQAYVIDLIDRILEVEFPRDISGICEGIKQFYRNEFGKQTDLTGLNNTLHKGIRTLDQVRSNEPLQFMQELIEVTHPFNTDTAVTNAQRHIDYMEFLLKIKHQNLFTPEAFSKQIDDVRKFIKSQFDVHVKKLASKLFEVKLLSVIQEICTEINKFYSGVQEKIRDVYILSDSLWTAHKRLSKVDVKNLQSLVIALDELKISIPREVLERLDGIVKEMKLLPEQVTENVELWKPSKAKYTEILQLHEKTALWYNYMVKIFHNLSAPVRDTQGSDKKAIEALLKECDHSSTVDEFNFKLLSDFVPGNKDDLVRLGNLPLSGGAKKTLKTILSSLIAEPSITCHEAYRMIVKGPVIRMSQVTSYKKCIYKARYIQIFAYHSVIIDTSIEKHGSDFQMVIMSPVWTVIGNQRFIFEGDAGLIKTDASECHPQSFSKGKDGEAGSPGGQGGIFLGIGDVFHNGDKLTISSEAGKGGPGQNGGKGPKGVGATIPVHAYRYLWTMERCHNCAFCHIDTCKREYLDANGYEYNLTSSGESEDTHRRRGESGTDGGKGGNGGIGGFGGVPGPITIIEIVSKSRIVSLAREGSVGDEGKGGNGGDPTVRSIILESKLDFYYATGPTGYVGVNVDSTDRRYEDPVNKMTKTGPKGDDGSGTENLSRPEAPTNFHHPTGIVNNYKKDVRSYAKNNFSESKLNDFISRLEKKPQIVNLSR